MATKTSSVKTFDRNKISTFLKTINLRNEVENKEALFTLSKDGMTSYIISADRTLAIRAEYKSECPEAGKVGITSLSSLISYIDSMEDKFKLDVNKNKMVLASKNTKISVILQSPEYVVNTLEEQKFNELADSISNGISVALSKTLVKDIIGKFSILGSKVLSLKSAKGKLVMCVENQETEAELEATFEVENLSSDFEITLPKYFIIILSILKDLPSENISISFLEENPRIIGIKYQDEEISLDYLLALIPSEEQTAKPSEEENEQSS